MNAVAEVSSSASALSAPLRQAADEACSRIAPTWPLEQLIAVNPWWELRDLPLAEVTARLAALGGVRCLMPGDYYRSLWRNSIEPAHLQGAAAEAGLEVSIEQLLAHLEDADSGSHWHNVSDLLDGVRDRQHRMAWRDEITHQISQLCAAAVRSGLLAEPRRDAAAPRAGTRGGALYRYWLGVTRGDRGISILMGEPDLDAQFDSLPEQPDALLAQAFAELEADASVAGAYAHALLLDVNGWASWIAYLRFQDQLHGSHNALLQDLLAIRLAWDLVLWRHQAATDAAGFRHTSCLWRKQLGCVALLFQAHRDAQQLTWVWQRAAELAYQQGLHQQLRLPSPPPAGPDFSTGADDAGQPENSAGSGRSALLQAVFCIDVRSEVMRRALEAQDPAIRTLGFAGFFGLPIDYQPTGTNYVRPQLPGLLKPALRVTDRPQADPARGRALDRRARWAELTDAAPAMFSVVEAAGLRYAFKLLRDSLFPAAHQHPVNRLVADASWTLSRDGQELTATERAELAGSVLRAMGLVEDFATTVLLVGHGSSSRNNPHAAALDCGACGGQTGEVNVRVLAMLLNDPAVREALQGDGIRIPRATRFVAALHDTTTDEVRCFDQTEPDPTLQAWLNAAGQLARAERAPDLGLAGKGNGSLRSALRRRARDWSQVRPEWGLADNASFIIAPRARTRGLDLEGRAFLHDYCWRADDGFAKLEMIMTAPMLVTHWINMQYNASAADNLKYGSGNKVLHNVVFGNPGVFEGNGGDLRIGLPLQSLHDGARWMHRFQRLSVYVSAPAEAIADIAARHDTVRQLIDNDWLFLFRLDDDGATIERFYQGGWTGV
ncbi:MAG: DUF2309 domain-containing protein [Pseudomonadales bacterium]